MILETIFQIFFLYYLEHGYDRGQQLFIAENINSIYLVLIEEHVKAAKNLGHLPIEKEITEEDYSSIENLLEEQMNY